MTSSPVLSLGSVGLYRLDGWVEICSHSPPWWMDQEPVQKMSPGALEYVVKMPSACQELQKEKEAECKCEGPALLASKAWLRTYSTGLRCKSIPQFSDVPLQPRPLIWVPDSRVHLHHAPSPHCPTSLLGWQNSRFSQAQKGTLVLPAQNCHSPLLSSLVQERTPPFAPSVSPHIPLITTLSVLASKSTLNPSPFSPALSQSSLSQQMKLSQEFSKRPTRFCSYLSLQGTLQGQLQ